MVFDTTVRPPVFRRISCKALFAARAADADKWTATRTLGALERAEWRLTRGTPTVADKGSRFPAGVQSRAGSPCFWSPIADPPATRKIPILSRVLYQLSVPRLVRQTAC